MKNKHMIVISVDAMVYEDLEYARTLPNFSRLLDGASIIERVRSTYPSVTHTAHATIMSGCVPGRTGVVNNTVFDRCDPKNGSSTWYNDLDQLSCESLLHAAKRAGLTTAVSTWPMTSHGEDFIDYLVPNAMNEDFVGHENDPLGVFRALGAQACIMDLIGEAVSRFGWKNEHPAVDELQAYCAAEIIKRYRPNLLLTHPSFVDSARHRSGVFGPMVEEALRATDRWIGMLFDAVEEAGIGENTDFVLLSDHGQINISRVISFNVFLADAGYLTLDDRGEILSWRVYVKSTGASAEVYLRDPEDGALEREVYEFLSHCAREGIYGISRVLTREEARKAYGLWGDFSFVLEGDGYTGFGDRLTRPAVRNLEFADLHYAKGTHGHDPDRGPQPTFIANGPSFCRDVRVARGDLKNHAPTVARAMGFPLPDADGRAIDEILKS